jgi:hypothetical protein
MRAFAGHESCVAFHSGAKATRPIAGLPAMVKWRDANEQAIDRNDQAEWLAGRI